MASHSSTTTANALLLAAVALVGLNLRPFMTGIGPLAADIGAATGLDLKGLALLTLVPMLLMGILAFGGPWLQSRIGARRAVIGALVLLALGSGLRFLADSGWQMVGTAALLGLGVAVIQAVFPGVVKCQFPRHVGPVMGLYSAMLMGGGALGAQLAPLVASVSGNWRMGLAWMAVPAILALALAIISLPANAAGQGRGGRALDLLKRRRTWLLMVCFGLVNGGYSTVITWISPYYQGLGWSPASSGGLLAALALAQALAALILPLLAGRNPDRRPWLWFTLALQAIGFSALLLKPEAAPLLWALLLGAGLGGCFALSMIVALDHLPDPAEAGALSALMQGGGFLLASLPPLAVAYLHDFTGSFLAGWLLHLCAIAIVTALYFSVSPQSYAPAMNGRMR